MIAIVVVWIATGRDTRLDWLCQLEPPEWLVISRHLQNVALKPA